MAAALEARAVIRGEDRTKAAFDSIKARITALTQQAEAFDRIMGTVGHVARSMEGAHGSTERMAEGMTHVATSARSMGTVAESVGHVERSLSSGTVALTRFNQRMTEADAKVRTLSRTVRASRGGHGSDSLLGMGGLLVAHEAQQLFGHIVENYKEFDKERRYGKVVMGLTDAQQEPLIQQAIHGAASSRFNDIQWLESQRELAARGYNRDQVMAFTPIAAQIGQAFDVAMPQGVKALEGALLGFHKDTSTFDSAMRNAQRSADLQVKASKISGMAFEDIVQLYKYAAAPAQMAHLSEESMLAYGAISKKANMGGDESGVAFRALAKNLLTPTHEAMNAMLANGIDFTKYQSAPKAMNLHGFVDAVARTYGVQLNTASQAGIGKIFADPKLMADPSLFTPAVTHFLQGALGKQDAKSLKSIAGLARTFRNDSVGTIDTNRLLADLMAAMAKSPGLANALFGSKQGGRIYAALGDPKFFNRIMEELLHESQGFAAKVSDARMEGFYANLQKLQNSMMNVDTAIGRAFDGNGSGGFLSDATGAAAAFTQKLAEADPIILRAGAELGALAAAAAALKGFEFLAGGFGLKDAAHELIGAAGAIKAAEVVHEAEGGLPAILPGGKRAAGKLAAREGEQLAAGAIAAETVEVVAAGAASISVGTLAIAGIAAVAVIDALSHGPRKPRASDDPDFGNPWKVPKNPLTFDGRDPYTGQPPHPASGRGWQHPSTGGRFEPPSEKKWEQPGHLVIGRGGVREWVVDAPKKLSRLFGTGIDLWNLKPGLLGGAGTMGFGAWPGNPFAKGMALTHPTDFPALPDSDHPGWRFKPWTFPAPFPHTDTSRAPIGDGLKYPHTDPFIYPARPYTPVPPRDEEPPPHRYAPQLYRAPADEDLDPQPPRRYPALEEHEFHQPAFPHTPTPTVDPSATDVIFQMGQKADEAKVKLTELGNTHVAPQISMEQLDALIAKASQAKAALAALGTATASAGSRANLGPSYPAAAPTGRMG